MKHKKTTALVVGGVLGVMLGACSTQNPCDDIKHPGQAGQALVDQGYDVEFPVSEDLDCELTPDGRWIPED